MSKKILFFYIHKIIFGMQEHMLLGTELFNRIWRLLMQKNPWKTIFAVQDYFCKVDRHNTNTAEEASTIQNVKGNQLWWILLEIGWAQEGYQDRLVYL